MTLCVCPLCNGQLSDDEPCAMVPAHVAYGEGVPIYGTSVAVHPACKAGVPDAS